jgi:hypothetical protein
MCLVIVPGYTTEMYCVLPVRYELNLYILCRRKSTNRKVAGSILDEVNF